MDIIPNIFFRQIRASEAMQYMIYPPMTFISPCSTSSPMLGHPIDPVKASGCRMAYLRLTVLQKIIAGTRLEACSCFQVEGPSRVTCCRESGHKRHLQHIQTLRDTKQSLTYHVVCTSATLAAIIQLGLMECSGPNQCPRIIINARDLSPSCLQ
jgi:hypothetical protein